MTLPNKIYVLVLVFAFCIQCAVAQRASCEDIANAEDFERVELSRARLAPCGDSPENCALTILQASDAKVTEKPATMQVFDLCENLFAVLATFEVKDDDSVAGVRYRVEFNKNSEGKYEFVALGRQYRCARGRTGWSKELCP